MSVADWCVFLGGLLPVLVVFIAKNDPRLDIHNPRDVHLVQDGLRKRAYGAHLNGLEAFPFFAAAVVLAEQRGAAPPMLGATALAWLLVRLGYTGVYLLDWARIRPILWAAGWLIAAAIFFLPR